MGKFIKMTAIAVFAALFFSACSDDDDKLAKTALGEYDVNIALELFEMPLEFKDQKVLLEKNGDYVDISLEINLNEMDDNATRAAEEAIIPIKIKGATLSGKKENIAINYSGKMELPKALVGDNNDEGANEPRPTAAAEMETAEVEATIEGTLKNEKDITLKIEVKGTIVGDLEINVTGKRSTKEA